MRTIVLICLMMVAGSLVAGTTLYRWVDEQGRVHYSDTPQADAAAVEIANPMTFDASAGIRPEPQTDTTSTDRRTPAKERFAGYDSVGISAPAEEQVLWNIGAVLTVTLSVRPALRPGHSVRVTYDGTPVADWPNTAITHQLRDVYRGTHVLSVSVVDAGGTEVATGQPVTFYVKQSSILNR
ncbi:MAG: DUF4124 domain-containing protein [Gammaproteobacteria bacterium]|nr:DUF4124 domain-containing protein [Gammaproteobacteria bacterium]